MDKKIHCISFLIFMRTFSMHLLFVKIWANHGLFLFIFVLFTSQFNYKLKKHRWSAWDSNPGPQNGKHRQNHGAMAATYICYLLGLLGLKILSETCFTKPYFQKVREVTGYKCYSWI